jgi:4-amino-4-deoxy-L-arabinose transferase-like glycosyltransferase
MIAKVAIPASYANLVGWVRRSRAAAWLPPLLVLLLITAVMLQAWRAPLTDSIGKDASQNLRSALNLWKHGTYGESAVGAIPGYQREPFANWILAGHLKWIVRPPAWIHPEQLFADPRLLTRITQVNLFYLLGLMLALWGLCLRLIRPRGLAHLVALPVIFVSADAFAIHELANLNTELPAAWLLVLLSLTLVLLRQKDQWGWALLAGTVYGCLVLTKASGAYLALLVLPTLPLLLHHSRRRSLVLTLCVGLGFALTVLPWVGRNLHEFGTLSISSGSGDVLMYRTSYNQMTTPEYLGAFYAFAPRKMQDDVLGPMMGYSHSALECGGSLQRLRRQLPCDTEAIAEQRFADVKSFYKSVQHYMAKLYLDVKARRVTGPADSYLRRVALDRIKANPLKHVAVSLPLAWRGLWAFAENKTWFSIITNGLAMASLLAMAWLGTLMRRPDWTLTSMVGVGYFLFYALLSHFIPRYSEPLIPLALVCLAVLLVTAGRSTAAALAASAGRRIQVR